MLASRRTGLLLPLVIGLVGMAPPAAADLLSVEARTNYAPGFDFAVARTRVSAEDGREVAHGERTLFIGDDGTFRIADFNLPAHHLYRVEVELVHRTRRTVARRSVVADFRGNHVVTLLFAKPTGTAEKRVALLHDYDDDGEVSAGDVLRYTVVVDGAAARFADDPGPGLRLVIGSVTTTFGTVTRGNVGPDFLVVVDGLKDAEGPVTITFDCEVMPVLENQGALELADASETSSAFARISIPTDDPTTAAVDDPTRTLVSCTSNPQCTGDLASCEKELGTCRQERDTCQVERQALNDQLTALLADPDRDGVTAVLDLCPETGKGQAVDDRGCSQDQFCRRVDLAAPSGDQICMRADWRGDEPLGNPQDCRPAGGVCLPL